MTERAKYELWDFNSETSEYDEVTCDCGRFTFKTFLPIYDERGIAEETYFCDCGIMYYWAYGNVVEKVDNGIDWLLKRAEDAKSAESNLSAVRKYLREEEEQNKRYREALNNIITLWIASTDATDDTWLAHEMSETARKALEEDLK